MAWQSGAPATGEKAESVAKPFLKIRDRETRETSGSQLEGEGDAIKMTTDRRDRDCIGVVELESRPVRGAPLYEELDCLGLADLLSINLA
jgi:hypothetical protein